MALSWHRRTVGRVTRRARARFSPPKGRAAGASQKERDASRAAARVDHTLAAPHRELAAPHRELAAPHRELVAPHRELVAPHRELAKEIARELVGEIASEIADEIVAAKQNASVALTGALLMAVRAALRDHRQQQAQRLCMSVKTSTRLSYYSTPIRQPPILSSDCYELLLPYYTDHRVRHLQVTAGGVTPVPPSRPP